MKTFERNLNHSFKQSCLKDSEHLENSLETDTLTNIAGIQFPDYMTETNRKLDKNVSIGIR